MILDDAHAGIVALRSLIQLRADIGADDLRIIATTWPGFTSAVVKELALSDAATHELGPFARGRNDEVIKAHGVMGPDRLLALIRQQSRGKPGLAGTLAALALAGDTSRVLSGRHSWTNSLPLLLPW